MKSAIQRHMSFSSVYISCLDENKLAQVWKALNFKLDRMILGWVTKIILVKAQALECYLY